MLFATGIMSNGFFINSDEDIDDPDETGGPLPEVETVDVNEFINRFDLDGTEGSVTGTANADEITLNGSSGTAGGYVEILGENSILHADSLFDLIEIDAGAGDDLITVQSGSALITTGEGADTVDASGMEQGVIFANEGDLVLGSNSGNAAYDGIAVLADSATFVGGTSGEVAVATGTGSQLSGGGGDDVLLAFAGDAVLDGGEGNDTLIGNATSEAFCQCTRVTNVGMESNDSADTLIGGAGDDVLYLSNGDVATGGVGSDAFNIVANDQATLGAATITDFSPSEDTLRIEVWGGDPWDYEDASYDLTDRITQTVEDGVSVVRVDGVVTANIEGVTELSIGYPDPDSLGSHPVQYVDLETGDIAPASEFDVLVNVLQARSS